LGNVTLTTPVDVGIEKISSDHSFAMTIFHTINNSAKLVTLLIIPTYAKVSIYIRTQGSGRGYWGGVNNFLKDNVWSPYSRPSYVYYKN
jgi:hypothetical protein